MLKKDDLSKFKHSVKSTLVSEGAHVLQIFQSSFEKESVNGTKFATVKIQALTENGDKVFLKFRVGTITLDESIEMFEKRSREFREFLYTVLELEEDESLADWDFDASLVPKLQNKFFHCLIVHFKADNGNIYPNVDLDSVLPAYGFGDTDDEDD